MSAPAGWAETDTRFARHRRGGLAKLDQEGSHLTTQLDWVTMPSVGVACLSLGPHPLEEPIHRRTMHGDPTLAPGVLDRGSLLNLLDQLAFCRLTLLWGNGCLHRSDSLSLFVQPLDFL